MKKQTFLSFVAACAMLTGSLQAQAADRQFKDFSLILNNENGTILTADEMAAQDTDFAFGISVSDEGTVSRIATDATEYAAQVTGKFWNDHGSTQVKLVVPVDGPVKVTVGTCTYSDHNLLVSPKHGEALQLETEAACWKNVHTALASINYEGGLDTLVISCPSYTPYVAVEAYEVPTPVEPAQLENEPAQFAWAVGNESNASVNDEVAYALQESRVSVGTDLATKVYDASSNGGGKMISYQPSTSNPGQSTTDMVEYTIKLKKGYTFQVSSVSFDAVKQGTDNAYFGWTVTADGVESEFKAYSDPKTQILRNNNANKDVASLNHVETVNTEACRTFSLRLYMSNVANNKEMSIGNIKINGTVSGAEKVRSFKDFAIEFRTDPYTVVYPEGGLPEGVVVNPGTYKDTQHGAMNAKVTVPVDGPVCFYAGGCNYTNGVTITDKDGQVIGTMNTVEAGCDNAHPQAVTHFAKWLYNVEEPNVLTFNLGNYCPYFKANACEFVPSCYVNYFDTDGKTLIKSEEVLGGSALAYSLGAEAVTVPAGNKFRGWFNSPQSSAVKVAEGTPISEDINLYAKATPIEIPTNTSRYIYELNKLNFYIDDHEAIWTNGGKYHDAQHGWDFVNGQSLSIAVAGNCYVSMGNCRYSDSTTVVVKNAKGEELTSFINKAKTDGEEISFQYASPVADTLTFYFGGTTYVHKVSVFNVVDFVAYDESTGYYMIPANDGNSFLLALTAANGKGDVKIFLPNGTYDLGETALTSISGKNISIIGESMLYTIIKNAPLIENEGIGTTATLLNNSNNLYLQDLTLQNALDYYKSGAAGRAVCLQDKGTNTICKNVRMLSYQDTYYSNNASKFYWEDSEIHGTVDYLCGDGDVIYNRCLMVNESRSANGSSGDCTVCAPYHSAECKWGYVFLDCAIETRSQSFNFGRSWGGESKAVYIRTTLNQPEKLVSSRFTLSGMNVAAYGFYEFGTKNPNGQDITPASNVLTFTHSSGNKQYETILTAEKAAEYTIANIFGEWQPDQICAQLEATASATISEDKKTLSWTAVEGATAYLLILSTGEHVIVPATQTSFTAEEAIEGAWVRTANGRGGFGAAAVAGDVSNIETIQNASTAARTFDLQGRPAARRGLVIENGKVLLVK